MKIVLPVFCSLVAITVANSAAAETRALIVGVSAYQNLDSDKHLQAPRNDALQIRELLVKRGVKKTNMTLLADGAPGSAKNPTRQNIMEALRALTDAAQRGDFIIVYFSGHGSYQPDQPEGDPRHDEEDGYDEVFLPADVERTPLSANSKTIKNAIIDDELHEFAEAVRNKGADLWFILDSCFSGTGLRAAGQFRHKLLEPDLFGVKVEKTPANKKDLVSRAKPGAASRGSGPRGGYVFFSASRSNEPSVETTVPGSVPAKDATWRSVFTHTLTSVMTREPQRTYREIIVEVNRIMNEPGSRTTQTAGIEGPLENRLAFGHDVAPRPAAQWTVRRDSWVDGGVADGVEKGAILALYDKPDAKDGDASGYARVIEANATEARISPLREYPCPVVEGNAACRDGGSEIVARARYARLIEPPLDFAFKVSAPQFSKNAPEPLRARATEIFDLLRAPSAGNKQLHGRVQFDDKNYDFIWWVTAEGFRIAPAGSKPSELEVGAAVDLTGKEPLEELKLKAERILLRAYRVERLRRVAAKDLEGVSGGPRLKVGFEVTPLSYDKKNDRCEPEEGAKPKAVVGALVTAPCTRVQVNVTNQGLHPRFVSVFLIDEKWNIFDNVFVDDSCAQGGVDPTLAPRATRKCKIDFGLASPGAPDISRYTLAILSTPHKPGVAPRSFEQLKNLNNDEPATTRSASASFSTDDGVTGGAEGTRSADRNPASVTWVEWDQDRNAPK